MKRTKLVYHPFFTHCRSGRMLNLRIRSPLFEPFCLIVCLLICLFVCFYHESDITTFIKNRYTVSHFSYAPFFQGPQFLTKMLEATILYDNLFMTFYLFDDIEKKYWNHSSESFCYVKGNFDKNAKMHVQAERLYFLFLFCASHYLWWSLWQKNTKNNYFIQVKPPFSVVEFSSTVTFWRNARFDVI